MEVKLIRVLREQASSGFTEELARYFKDVDLIMEPKLKMSIRLGDIEFFIDHIEQDLNSYIIILYEYIDIIYHQNRNSEGFKKEREILSNDNWKLL